MICWIGAKRLLRKTISQFALKDIQGYIEPFGGAAWILFGKSANKEDWQISKKSRYTEVYNGINDDLVNFGIMQGYKYMPLRNLEKVKAASKRLKQVII